MTPELALVEVLGRECGGDGAVLLGASRLRETVSGRTDGGQWAHFFFLFRLEKEE